PTAHSHLLIPAPDPAETHALPLHDALPICEKLWEGQLELAQGAANDMTVTAVPVGEVLGDMAPGAYVITAKVTGSNQDYWREMADRKSTRLNSSHVKISYAVCCLKKKKELQ